MRWGQATNQQKSYSYKAEAITENEWSQNLGQRQWHSLVRFNLCFPAQKRNLFLRDYYKLMLNTHLYFTPAAPFSPVKVPGEKEQGIPRLFNLLLFATQQMVTPNNY